MKPISIAPNLHLIPLDQNLPGFTSFIGSWLYKDKKTFLVDVGPASTIPLLVKSLKAIDVQHIDAIFLTHIHIDHAGGIGDLSVLFPPADIVCHESGIRHLVDPSRLWEGSLKSLGQTARTYGPFRPVRQDLLYSAANYNRHEILPIMTPGHAPHHVSYFVNPYLFAGEAGGVFVNVPGIDFYLRPATPPKFLFEIYVNSIDELIAVEPAKICYGHFGMTENAIEMLKTHKKQLFLWKKIIKNEMTRHPQTGDGNLMASCLHRLLKEDPLLKGFSHFDEATRTREKIFFQNSIKGFIEYLQAVADNS